MADAAKGKVYPVHNNVFKFGTAGLESTTEQMVMPADLENFAPSIDGTVEEWYSMDAAGWAKAAMTGKKLGFSFKGKRSVGDPGNESPPSRRSGLKSNTTTSPTLICCLRPRGGVD